MPRGLEVNREGKRRLALGHNSKAVHWAYAGLAEVELPSLGEFERQRAAFANGIPLSPGAAFLG